MNQVQSKEITRELWHHIGPQHDRVAVRHITSHRDALNRKDGMPQQPSDAAGNTATEILVVTIANDAADFNGVYNVHDSVPFLPAFLYTIKVTPSQTINNRIEFDYNTGVLGFAYYQNNGNIYATSTGTGIGATVTLPFQIANTIGSPAENHDFQGNGTVLATSPFKFNITYTDHNISNSSTASGCIMTLTKI